MIKIDPVATLMKLMGLERERRRSCDRCPCRESCPGTYCQRDYDKPMGGGPSPVWPWEEAARLGIVEECLHPGMRG
ncbi:MAG: hypothetical protein QXR87_06290 [Candidatus Hadarchaeales archaeon]